MEDFNWESKIVSIVISVLVSFGLAKLGCGKILSSIGGEAAGAATENSFSTKSSSKNSDEYPAKKLEKKDYSTSDRVSSPSFSTPSLTPLPEFVKPTKCLLCDGKGFSFQTIRCMECDITGRVSCVFCKGTGLSPSGLNDCSLCKGWGMHNCLTCDGDQEIVKSTTCTFCNGTGK
jgi:DnaJ-class molecular chaperone